jgi:hypothetical protein
MARLAFSALVGAAAATGAVIWAQAGMAAADSAAAIRTVVRNTSPRK